MGMEVARQFFEGLEFCRHISRRDGLLATLNLYLLKLEFLPSLTECISRRGDLKFI